MSRALSSFTVTELDALPVGYRFVDPSDGDTLTKEGGDWRRGRDESRRTHTSEIVLAALGTDFETIDDVTPGPPPVAPTPEVTRPDYPGVTFVFPTTDPVGRDVYTDPVTGLLDFPAVAPQTAEIPTSSHPWPHPPKARCWRCGANDNESDDLRAYLRVNADPTSTADQVATALDLLTEEDRALVAPYSRLPPKAARMVVSDMVGIANLTAKHLSSAVWDAQRRAGVSLSLPVTVDDVRRWVDPKDFPRRKGVGRRTFNQFVALMAGEITE